MKLEKLSKGYFKKFIIILVVISILGIIFINKSKAKYRVTKSIQIVNGEVNYKPADLNVLALYKQKVEGNTNDDNYETITDVPENGYTVNTAKSYCNVPGVEGPQKNIPMKYENGEIYIGISKKGTKCYVWLDINNSLSNIIKNQVKNEKPDFSKTSCKNGTNDGGNCGEETNGVYAAEDDYGMSYYFRGTIDNNWVKFGKVGNDDIWWRIVRINGNGTVRLIYAGTGSIAPTVENITLIATSPYNTSSADVKYVQYMYDTNTNSTIKNVLDEWYLNTSTLKSLENKIDGETGFCNDTTRPLIFGDRFYFDVSERHNSPTFHCWHQTSDLYTMKGSLYGNNKLTSPIGLISRDEVAFAGGKNENNKGYYLYINKVYWTMTPYDCSLGYTGTTRYCGCYRPNQNGFISAGDISMSSGVRPVINLKADTVFKTEKEENKGTADNPYIVE